MIYCQVERPAKTRVNNVEFDLSKNRYYLLMASGSALRTGSVDYHDINRAASASALNLAEISNIAAKSKFLLRLHGSLMILAWIGSTSLGIMMARYFKLTWRRSSMCGKDLWFAVSFNNNIINFYICFKYFMVFPVVASITCDHHNSSQRNCLHCHFCRVQRMVICQYNSFLSWCHNNSFLLPASFNWLFKVNYFLAK
jgi:hypothetical protein